MRWLLLAVFTGAIGCSADASSDGNHFKDTAGRSCTVDGDRITCTGDGAMCTAPASPTFVVIGLDMSPMELCPACHQADDSTDYDTAACTRIVCQSAADCGFSAATCKAGECWCASGKC